MISKNKIHFYGLMLLGSLAYLSCNNDDSANGSISGNNLESNTISVGTKDTIIYLTQEEFEIPVYLSIPEGSETKPLPAVVVMHGSFGMWSQNNPDSKTLSGQFVEWKDILTQNGIVGAFVDSYSARGVLRRTGKWRELPDNIRISAQFIRPKDANATLTLLQNLKYDNQNSVVKSEDIALLGFSDGASAVLSSLIDIERVPSGFEWTQSSNGKSYDNSDGILPPQPKPEIPFAGGVYYYGGAVGYNYFGKHPCGSDAMDENVYYPYAPILFQIPSEDNLTENTLCLFDILGKKQAPVEIEYYEGMPHGFDFDGLEQSFKAREKTIGWLKNLFESN